MKLVIILQWISVVSNLSSIPLKNVLIKSWDILFIAELNCCNSTTYQNQKEVYLLPGHRKLILKLRDYLHEMQMAKTSISSKQQNTLNHSNEFSTLLKMLIETAEQNSNKIPIQYRYSDTIRYFAVYIYRTSIDYKQHFI